MRVPALACCSRAVVRADCRHNDSVSNPILHMRGGRRRRPSFRRPSWPSAWASRRPRCAAARSSGSTRCAACRSARPRAPARPPCAAGARWIVLQMGAGLKQSLKHQGLAAMWRADGCARLCCEHLATCSRLSAMALSGPPGVQVVHPVHGSCLLLPAWRYIILRLPRSNPPRLRRACCASCRVPTCREKNP